MTDHPITPPPELVQQWVEDWVMLEEPAVLSSYLVARAAQWGADQELEVCCEWLEQNQRRWEIPASLRAARRPKPPSLKEQALETLKYPKDLWSESEVDTIRRALEQFND